jgi:hypothetical protein
MSRLIVDGKKCATSVWNSTIPRFEHGRQWLIRRQDAVFVLIGIGVVLLLLIFSGVTAAVAAVAAWIALLRHFAQTDADRQRRITESYSKAVDLLGSDKIEARLGGIYTLERISRESAADYWTVIETLMAFIRERARPIDADTVVPDVIGQQCRRLPTDVAAVVRVLVRRPENERNREKREGWRLDLSGVDLRRASLSGAHLEGANLHGALLKHADLSRTHLEGANLERAHLEEANLTDAFLERARLEGAHLEGARLGGAHLEQAYLWGAHLEGANLVEAHLEGASLVDAQFDERARLGDARLEGTNLVGATISQRHLESAFGNAATLLPAELSRPVSWSQVKTPAAVER